MIEWEKRNGIDLQVKNKKSKRKYKAKQNNRLGNKENIGLAEGERKESLKEKEKRIQEVTKKRIKTWIKGGLKENWLSFKNN